MSLESVNHYLRVTDHDPLGIWRLDDLAAVSSTPPPDIILQRNETILRADAYTLWLRWFMEGLCRAARGD